MNANPAERFPSDSELLDDIQQGSKEAVEILCNKHDRELRAVIISFLVKHGCFRPPEHAEGIKSEVWIHILSKLDDLRDSNKFAAWRDAIARNEGRNHLRHCIPEGKSFLELTDDSFQTEGRFAELDKVIEDAELADWLFKAADNVSAPFGRIIALRYKDDSSWDEIADQLGISKAALHSCYYRGLIKLRKKLGGRGG
ncbi:MAG: hypothetical protein QOJ64_2578 [Acidobacteriota bacterium]|jgi:RNA polymerase sigma factor (sigma-70 family)|nr:hypothetical protein [Acidobacteriota bacterium]